MPKTKQEETPFDVMMADSHQYAAELARKVFGVATPDRHLINAIHDGLVVLDDKRGHVDRQATDADVAQFVAHREAAETRVREMFGVEAPTLTQALDLYSRAFYFFDDDRELDEDTMEAALSELSAARAWAEEQYADGSPEATFQTYDRVFDDDGEE